MAGIMSFLKKHIPKTFDDVKKQYMVAVKEIMMNRVKSYRELYVWKRDQIGMIVVRGEETDDELWIMI